MASINDGRNEKIDLGPKLFASIIKVLEDPTGMTKHPNIAFGGKNATQKINIVGESFYQEAISQFREMRAYGFLVPDQNNEFDKNAVALYLINQDLMIHRVGHLPRDLAAKVSQLIANLLASNNQIIPVIAKIEGGTRDKPLMGVFAVAKTNAIAF